jgi:hypothetical protein
VGLGPWNFLLRWHFWNVCKVEFLGFICAGWQVCWNRHSSTVDYIIYLSGVIRVVFSASDIFSFMIFFLFRVLFSWDIDD